MAARKSIVQILSPFLTFVAHLATELHSSFCKSSKRSVIDTAPVPSSVPEVPVRVEGVPPLGTSMTKLRLAASKLLVAVFPGFLLVFPVLVGLLISDAEAKDMLLKEFKIKT